MDALRGDGVEAAGGIRLTFAGLHPDEYLIKTFRYQTYDNLHRVYARGRDRRRARGHDLLRDRFGAGYRGRIPPHHRRLGGRHQRSAIRPRAGYGPPSRSRIGRDPPPPRASPGRLSREPGGSARSNDQPIGTTPARDFCRWGPEPAGLAPENVVWHFRRDEFSGSLPADCESHAGQPAGSKTVKSDTYLPGGQHRPHAEL